MAFRIRGEMFRRPREPEISPDPAEWRPQGFGGKGLRSIANPIVEPGWSGVRSIVTVRDGVATIRDEDAVECTAEFAVIAQAIVEAAQADHLVLDGYLTIQPTQDATGKIADGPPPPDGRELTAQMLGGSGAARAIAKSGEDVVPLDPDRPIAFVAVDLLAIDDSVLLDVPLLERKRLLDGALRQSEIVRVTPFVRLPLGSFLPSWRSLGFDALIYKDPNGRYRPNQRNDGWVTAPMPRR